MKLRLAGVIMVEFVEDMEEIVADVVTDQRRRL